jgi:hypothetical protein
MAFSSGSLLSTTMTPERLGVIEGSGDSSAWAA